MTTHTDRKSAEILVALDKLAENGMPFIDVVKQGGFSGFPAKGVQPLPTEPVQIYEDPGAAYWQEATKMAEHTDRIRQMAQEAGIQSPAEYDGHSTDCPWIATTDELARFAQLVAEDLTADDDALAEKMAEHLYGHSRSDAVEWAKEDKFDSEKDKALALIAVMREHIRARYSLKD